MGRGAGLKAFSLVNVRFAALPNHSAKRFNNMSNMLPRYGGALERHCHRQCHCHDQCFVYILYVNVLTCRLFNRTRAECWGTLAPGCSCTCLIYWLLQFAAAAATATKFTFNRRFRAKVCHDLQRNHKNPRCNTKLCHYDV